MDRHWLRRTIHDRALQISALLPALALVTAGSAAWAQSPPQTEAVLAFKVLPSDPPGAIQAAVDRAVAARSGGDQRPITITLAPGLYRPSAPIAISGDFGPAGLTIAGGPGGPVEISGAVVLKAADSFRPSGKDRLALAAAGTDAKAMIFIPATELSAAGCAGSSAAAVDDPAYGAGLYQGAAVLSVARWPQSGYVTTKRLPDPGPGLLRISVPGANLPAWSADSTLWVEGYFRNSYTFERLPISAFDGNVIDIPITGPAPGVGWQPRIAIDNVSDGLKLPGAYGVMGGCRTVAIHSAAPGAPIEKASLDAVFLINTAKNVTIKGLSVGKVQKTAISVLNSQGITVADSAAGWAGEGIIARGSTDVVVRRTVVHDTGGRGIVVNGGDRTTLTSGGNKIIDSVVTNFGLINKSYHAGVTLSGVGAEISGSLVMNGPHAGLIFFGNNHLIRNNEFTRLVMDGGDAGGVYVGRDWTQRGTHIEGNYFHDIGSDVFGIGGTRPSSVYLDDYSSGITVEHNLFVRTSYGVLVGGGRDNIVQSNSFVAAAPVAIRFDSRGETFGRDTVLDPTQAPLRVLRDVPIDGALYRKAYPHLATILTDDPRKPKYNVIDKNRYFGAVPFWLFSNAQQFNTIEPPLVGNIDTALVNRCVDQSEATLEFLRGAGVVNGSTPVSSRLQALGDLRYFSLAASKVTAQRPAC